MKRKAHNKGKTRIKYTDGNYSFVNLNRERYSGLLALSITVIISVISMMCGNYIKAQNITENEANEAMNNNLIESHFIVEKNNAQDLIKSSDKSEKLKIINYIVEVFGEDSAEAITIIRKCENSKFDPKATNWNKNGTWDTGIFQINQVHGYSLEDMQNYKKNIDVAKKIFDKRGWTAWSCSHVVGIKSFCQ